MRARDMHKLPLFIGRVKYTPDGTLTCVRTGKVKGSRTSNGYLKLQWNRGENGLVECYAHRFVWYLHHGEIAEGLQVDHINLDKTDNRIENLRLVTVDYNNQNRKFRGYSWNKKMGQFKAQILVKGKSMYLGSFDKEEDARAAYINAKLKYHGGTTKHSLEI